MNGDGISYWDENGTLRTEINARGFRGWSENGTIRVALGDGGIGYHDEGHIVGIWKPLSD